jgi:PAS domain S-box-containing protein
MEKSDPRLEDEATYRFLIENISDIAWRVSTDLHITYVSPACERQYGYKPEELIGRLIFDFMAPASAARIMELFLARQERAARGERLDPLIGEIEQVCKDGRTIWTEVVSNPVYDPDGHLAGFQGISRDIADRKRSEERFRTLSRASFEGVVISQQGIIRDCNEQLEKMLGFSREELIGKPIQELLPPEAVELVINNIKSGREVIVDHDLVCKDGSRRNVESHGRMVMYGGEEFRITALHDITERKRIEDALVKAGDEWEQTFNSMTDMVMILDMNHTIVKANRAMAQKLGLSQQDAVGLTCYEHVHGITEPPGNCPHAKLLLDGQVHTEEVYEERLGGYFIVSVAPLYDSNGRVRGAVHIAKDITARKRMEERLRESEELYRRLFETETDAIFIVDVDSGRFIDANTAAERLYGYSREEFMQMNVNDISAEPDSTRQSLEAQEAHVPLRRHRRKDGTVLLVEIEGSYFEYKGHKTHVATIRDITERKRMEKEILLQSEITANMAEGVALMQASDLSILYTNKKFDTMFGYHPGELTGRQVSALISEAPGKNPQDIVIRIEQELIAKGVVSRELLFRRKDGVFSWSWANISEYKDPEHDLLYILVAQDISERKRAEESLIESEERFRTLFASSLDAVLMTTPAGDILEANEAAGRLFGCTEEDLKQMGCKGIFDASDARVEKGFKKRARSGTFLGEMTCIRRGGSKFIGEISSASFQNAQGELRNSTVIRDITARKKSEAALKESEQKLLLRSRELEEMNSALKVLLAQREKDKQELGDRVLTNVKKLVLPYVDKIKKGKSKEDAVYLRIIESNLQEVISSFATTLSGKLNMLTPQEIIVASLVREGKPDKDIAEILDASIHTVKTHRKNIRKKLGLSGERASLKSYLFNLK